MNKNRPPVHHRIISLSEGIENRGSRHFKSEMKDFLICTIIWRKISGCQIRKNSYVYKYKNGVLYVKCSNSVWANELALMREQILAQLQAEENAPEIRNIQFDYLNYRSTEKVWKKPVNPNIEVSSDMLDAADTITRNITAPELKNAVKKAYIAQCKAEIYDKTKE